MIDSGYWTFAATLVIPLFLCAISTSAQSIWTSQTRDSSVGVEWLRPSMSGDGKMTFFSSSLPVPRRPGNLRIPVDSELNDVFDFVVELNIIVVLM